MNVFECNKGALGSCEQLGATLRVKHLSLRLHETAL